MSELGFRSWPWLSLRWLVLVLLQLSLVDAACVPESGCDVAYAYYKAQANETLDSIGVKFQTTADAILAVNPSIALDNQRNFISTNQPLYIPFTCECLQNGLYHAFDYQVQRSDDIESITSTVYEDLTQKNWVATWNALADPNFILTGADFKIPVKCFCGNPSVSLSYGLFLTYVLAGGHNLSSLASEFNTTEALLRNYNPSVNWNDSQTVQYAFIPVSDQTGKYPLFSFGSSNADDGLTTAGVLTGVAIGVGGALLFLSLLALCRRCLNMEQRRRQERRHLENKLKSLEVDPIRTTDNEVKV
jgi:LysM repeat protein